jgi:hypothetical protein
VSKAVLCRKKRFRAWVVHWDIREDKVAKCTGTVITLLPSRYATRTVAKIIEALYCAYAFTYDGQFGYLVNRNKGKRLSRETFDGRVVIGENPGLSAVLAEDVSVEIISTDGNKQIISWTDPDYYEPTRGEPRVRKVGSGQFHKLEFDYLKYVQKELS